MGRFHLFELNDQPWFPNTLRVLVTDWLQMVIQRFGLYRAALPLLQRGLRGVDPPELVDLCSGGSGPLLPLLDGLAKEGHAPKVVLTDLYPNVAAFERAAKKSPEQVTFEPQSVDATRVPAHLGGLRTIFTAFHHFRPAQALAILGDAARRKRPIAIFEFTGRDWMMPLRALFTPLLVLLLTPWVRPFRWSRLLFTYVIPIAPLLLLWDGVVSDLRTYSPAELRAMVAKISSEGYAWRMGRTGGNEPPVTYLLGEPADDQRQSEAP